MKSLIFFTLFALASVARAQLPRADFGLLDDVDALSSEVPAPVQNVFVPQGFDSNDSPEIVIAGTFPNSCWKMGRTTHQYSHEEKKVYVDVRAKKLASDVCLTITVPFMVVVKLESLEAGDYAIAVNTTVNASLPISQAPNSQVGRDDYLYAMVYGLIKRSPTTFEIQGSSPNECYEVYEIKVLPESDNVITVLPKMQKIEGCRAPQNAKAVAWIKSFEVPERSTGKVLIHVRTLNGGSVNQVVDLE